METYDYTLTRALDWQRNKATALPKLLKAKQDWYQKHHHDFWTDWFNNVFNLKTANSFGLLVWSYILNTPAQAFLLFPKNTFWAFGATRQNFYHVDTTTGSSAGGNFIGGDEDIIMTPTEARKALQLKYYSLITNGSVTELNAALLDVFGTASDGKANAYVLDNQDMTMTYCHRDTWSSTFTDAIVKYDMIPKVAGISFTIKQVS